MALSVFFLNLLGYAAPATLFLGLGIWHLLCSSAAQATSSPSTPFMARAWYPITRNSRHGLELYAVLLCVPLGMGYELAMATNTDPLVRGGTPTFRMATALHLALLFFMALAAAITILLARDAKTHAATFGLAAVAFTLQYKVVAFDTLIAPPLESRCSAILGGVVGSSAVLCASLALQPAVFFLDLLLGMSLLMQGLWRFQTWMSLHFDPFIPSGCHRLLHVAGFVEGSTQCDLESDTVRAVSLMDLLFMVHALIVILITFTLYAIVFKVKNPHQRHPQVRYIAMEAIPTL